MATFMEIVSPLGRGRRYGALSALFLFVVILSEIEGLAFLALGLVAGRPDFFLGAQEAIFPAAWVVAAATAGATLWRARRWSNVGRGEQDAAAVAAAEMAASFLTSDWQKRIGIAHLR